MKNTKKKNCKKTTLKNFLCAFFRKKKKETKTPPPPPPLRDLRWLLIKQNLFFPNAVMAWHLNVCLVKHPITLVINSQQELRSPGL